MKKFSAYLSKSSVILPLLFFLVSSSAANASTDTISTGDLLQASAIDLHAQGEVIWQGAMPVGVKSKIRLDKIDSLIVQDTPVDTLFVSPETLNAGVSDTQFEILSTAVTERVVTFLSAQPTSTETTSTTTLQGGSTQIVLQGNTTANNNAIKLFVNSPTETVTIAIPTLSQDGSLVINNVFQTITNKTISGASNTLTDIPNSALTNSSIKIVGGSGISVSSADGVSLGQTVTISSVGGVAGVSSLNSQTGSLTIAGSGINSIGSSGGTITISGTEADTLSSVTSRGAASATALTLSNSTNNVTVGTLTATGGTINGVTIGATTASSGVFTTVDGLAITNNGSNTLNIAAGKTLAINNSLTLAGTDGTTITLPSSSGTLVGQTSTDTLTNKTLTSPTINGTISTTGLTLPAFTAAGNISGSGSPTISSFGAINGLTLSSSSLQPAAAGALTLESNGANGLTLDTGGGAALNLGNTNATSIAIGNLSTNPTISLAGSGIFSTTTGANNLNGSVLLAANKNLTLSSGTGIITENYSNTSGTATTLAVTNSGSSGTNTVTGLGINITGTGNGTGSNTITGIKFGDVSSATNNIFNILTLGTGYNNFLTSPTINISAAGAITGLTGLTLSSGNFDMSASSGIFSTGTGTISLNGDTTIASGKTLVVATADKLTIGGKIVPQSLFVTVPLTAAILTQPVFIADTSYQVTGTKCVPSLASISGTLQVTVDTGTDAAGAGTSQLTGTVSLAGTVNTVVSGTLVGSPTTTSAGDRISASFGGTLTGLLGTCTIYLKRV